MLQAGILSLCLLCLILLLVLNDLRPLLVLDDLLPFLVLDGLLLLLVLVISAPMSSSKISGLVLPSIPLDLNTISSVSPIYLSFSNCAALCSLYINLKMNLNLS